jgi:ankyrin repeat protein
MNQPHFHNLSNELASKFRDNCLWFAAKTGLSRVVDVILSAAAHVETKLLDCGANILSQTYSGMAVLHIAASNGHESKIRLLIHSGASIQSKAVNGEMALHIAASNGYESTVRLLLDRSANIEFQSNNDETALHNVASRAHDSTVQLLLDRHANVNFQPISEQTALQNAALFGHESKVQLLLNYRAATEVQVSGLTALQSALSGEYEAIVRLLVDRGADIDCADRNEQISLLKTAFSGRLATVQCFSTAEPTSILWDSMA